MRDVYVSGMGVVTPIGMDMASFWQAAMAGTSGIGPVTRFDTTWLPVHIGAEIPDWDHLPLVHASENAGWSQPVRAGASAARQALADAGLLTPQGCMAEEEMEFYLGTTRGELHDFYGQYHQNLIQDIPGGWEKMFRALVVDHPIDSLLPKLARVLRCRGAQSLNTNSCAAGSMAIALGADRIRQGHAQRVLCGAVDILAEPDYIGFCSLRALAPERCQPFDLHRKGLVMGEAAAMLVLESGESLQQRGVRPWARLAGCGWSCDGYHLSAPQPQGVGVKLAIRRALAAAGVEPGAIDVLVAHGTGTPSNDCVEARAIAEVFGEHRPPVTAPKSMLGHAIGAASAVEAVLAIGMLLHNCIPPTINLETLDPECPVDCVALRAREKEIQTCLINALGFGGNNASLIWTRPAEARHV